MDTELRHNINIIKENYEHFYRDVYNFIEKGNKSAGTRARKALLEITKISKIVRKQIQGVKKGSDE